MKQDASSLQREAALPSEGTDPRTRRGSRDPAANPFCAVEGGDEVPAASLPENLRTLPSPVALNYACCALTERGNEQTPMETAAVG